MITARSKDQSFKNTSDAKVLRAKRKSIAFHTISHRFRICNVFFLYHPKILKIYNNVVCV